MEFSLYEIFWYFVIYAVLGWVVEVCFCSINTGSFVNRGFLNGPVCPIYGFGMVAVLVCLWPLRHNILVLYAGAVVLTSALELVTGWVLKKLFHTSWWDYSDQPFNIGGYICLKFSLAWGLCVVVVMRVVQPLVTGFIGLIVTPLGGVLGYVLAALVLLAFLCDLAVTVKAITKMNRDLGAIDDVARLLREGSDAVSQRLGTTALAVDENVDGLKLDAAARMDLLRAEVADQRHLVARRLVRAFPKMRHTRYDDALRQARDWLQLDKGKTKKEPKEKTRP